MALAMIRLSRILSLSLGILVVLSFLPSLLHAQGGPPGIDQYLVYKVNPRLPFSQTVLLRDQFSPNFTSHFADLLDYFANPVIKGSEQFVDERLHYTWWIITPHPFSARVVASNKFGDQVIDVREPLYLLNPALKFPQVGEQPPTANHYKCYRAIGQIPSRNILLHDQFGDWNAFLSGDIEFWCNPTEKEWPTGTPPDPIIRPDAHLVCYRIQVTPIPPQFPISFLDQFRSGNTNLVQPTHLCVPTFKNDVVSTENTTWGSLKATYR